jgi:predicted Zn-dependent peptidase
MIINLKSQTDLSGFYVIFEGSTNLEKPGWRGLGHLSEHLICKTFDHLQEDFDRDAVDWNAYTSSNEIVFYMTGLDEKIMKYKKNFVKLLTEFKTTKEEFENERKIVLEELGDCFNDQSQSHMLNLSRKLFNDFDPIGSRQDLEKMKFIDYMNFWELQFTKPTKIINVSKSNDFKDKSIEFQERKIVTNLSFGNHNTDLELNNDFKDKTSVVILSPVIEEDFAYVHFINAMLSLGLKSPLYQEIREKRGLVYFVHCYQSRVNDKGLNSISTLTSNKNFDEVIEAVKKVITNPDKFLTKERFNLVKEYYGVRKQKDEINRYASVNQWINPPKWSVYDILEDVTLKKIKEVYTKYYDFDKFYISSDKKEFKK